MKLYKILVQFTAPKDSHTSTEGYILAKNDSEVYDIISKELKCGYWIHKDDERFKERKSEIMEASGDIWIEQDWAGAYYGLTFHGWKEVECDNVDEYYKMLDRLGFIINSENYVKEN